MDNGLSKINLKWWHTVLIVVSFTIFVLSLTVEMKVLTNELISLLSSGVFFIALGSFANQSFQQRFHPKGIVTKDIMTVTFAGVVLILIGLVLLGFGVKQIFF